MLYIGTCARGMRKIFKKKEVILWTLIVPMQIM
jgi:hypothetical protein